VVFNNDVRQAAVSIPTATLRIPDNASFRDELGMEPDAQAREGQITVTLPPRSAAIYAALR